MYSVADQSSDVAAAINRQLTNEDKLRFLQDMYRIRRFEQTSLKYYNLGRMGGFLHLYSGQEAVAVGTVSLIREQPHHLRSYRPHAHALAVKVHVNKRMPKLL